MKKITLLLSFLVTIFFAKAQCDYVVDMQDSYGDGWNGASLDMLVNGTVVTSFTVTTTDATQATGSYSTYNGDNVEFYFNSGTWDTEITFQITAPDGSPVGSYGPYPSNSGNSTSVWTGVSNSTCVLNLNCLDLTGLNAGFPTTSSSVNLSWTPGGANSTSWNIEYGPAGFSMGSGTSTTSASPSATISGLTSNTAYDFYVQGDCGATNGLSNWVGPVTAQTVCDAVSAPYIEDFNGTTPTCWIESPNDVFDWTLNSGGTPSTGTGPSDDITGGGNYMHIETSLPRVLGDSAILISPAIDLSTMANPKLSFYSHMYGAAIGTLRIDASNDGGSTFSNVFTKSGDQGDQWNFEIASLAAFSDTVLFKVVAIVSDDGNGQAWTGDISIDNFEISEALALDVAGISMTTPQTIILANGPVTVSGKLQNMGTSTVTSMDINYTIDGGAIVSEPLSGLNLATGNYYDFSHGTTWSPAAAGTYDIEVWATNINGSTDLNTSNDMVSGLVTVYDNATIKRPMLESFTSSTCGPCVAGNVNVSNVLAGFNNSDYSLLKYQMSWPGSGDPYYTLEGGDRRNYYGVNSVPDFILDGNIWQGNSASLTGSQITSVIANPAFVEMSSYFTVDVTNQKVDVTVSIDPLGDFTNSLTLYTAIYEITTYNNTGSNGETSFDKVMKKMVPGSMGFALPTLQTGVSVVENFSHTFQGSYTLPPDANNPIDHATQHSIEDFNNLGVVTWIQDDATKEVIQSTVSTISATNVEELNTTKLMLFPNPAENTATVAFEGLEGSDVKIDLYNLLGELVFTGNHTSASSFDYYNIDVTTLNNGIYNLVLTVGESMTTKKLQILK